MLNIANLNKSEFKIVMCWFVYLTENVKKYLAKKFF